MQNKNKIIFQILSPFFQGSLESFQKMAFENIKDILAVGFDPKKTFIFRNTDYIKHLYPVAAQLAKKIPISQTQGAFGFKNSTNTGQYWYVPMQAAPAFPQAFPFIFGDKTNAARCLIPCAIDQDPFFRVTRDIAPRMGEGFQKPATVYSKFFPGLTEAGGKMSSSDKSTNIFMTDSASDIEKKVKRAVTGAAQKLEDHKAMGMKASDARGLAEDVPFQWLSWLLEDDEQLAQIAEDYSSGKMTSGEVKELLATEAKKIVAAHKEARAKISDEDVWKVMNWQAINADYMATRQEDQVNHTPARHWNFKIGGVDKIDEATSAGATSAGSSDGEVSATEEQSIGNRGFLAGLGLPINTGGLFGDDNDEAARRAYLSSA